MVRTSMVGEINVVNVGSMSTLFEHSDVDATTVAHLILQTIERNDVTLVLANYERIAIENANLSRTYRLSLKWSKETNDIPSTIVVKIPTSDIIRASFGDRANMADWLDIVEKTYIPTLHSNECKFYSLISTLKLNNKLTFVPKLFYAKTNEQLNKDACLAIEDFTDRTINQPLCRPLNLSQVQSTICHIASLHAWCIKDEDKTWINQYFDKRPAFGYSAAGHAGTALISLYPDLFNAEMFAKIDFCYRLATPIDQFSVMSAMYTGSPLVIVHGDLWTNNLLFSRSNLDQVTAIIDWQLTHAGCIAEDLTRLLISCVKPEDRRAQTNSLLQFYYNRLGIELESNPPFTMMQLKESYAHCFPLNAQFLAYITPLMLRDAKSDKERVDLLYRCSEAIKDTPQYSVEFNALAQQSATLLPQAKD